MIEQQAGAARSFSEGLAHGAAGRHDQAMACFGEAIALDPDHAAARFNLATALQHVGRPEEAADTLRALLERVPDQPDALFRLAGVLGGLDRHTEALEHLARLSGLAPRHPGLDEALGLALLRAGAPRRAEIPLKRALALDPACAVTLNNLGAAFMAQRRPDDAERFYRRAATVDAASPAYRKNLGISQLLQGKLVAGFRHYEARREQSVWGWNRSFPGKPEWRGEAIAGRTILVYFEQGLGDSVQFVRYFAVLKALGARTVFLCQRKLVALLATVPGIDALVADGDPLPDFDCHTSLMSLPDRLGTTISTIPRDIPYLRADPEAARRWAGRIAGDGLRVGVHWRALGPERVIPDEALAPLAGLPGVHLYSLQPGTEEASDMLARFGIVMPEEIASGRAGFDDTAGMLANLDVAVCCDSSVAHIAGAMGLPVLMILPWLGDWRWMLDPHGTPWYPRTRLFRSPAPGDWNTPVRAAVAMLAELAR